MAIAGVVCQLGPMVGLVGSMIGVMGAYDTIGKNPGIENPAGLSESIGSAMVITAIGQIIGIVGLILVTVSVSACRYRAEWFFTFLVIYGF